MKIAVLLSGGVDSTVSLHLLKQQGHLLHAFYLKIWLQEEFSHLGDCPWEDDLRIASQVCKQLQVELSVINLQSEYWSHVIHNSIQILKNGGTPSPDILCNQIIKFDFFLKKIQNLHFDKIASGHYAQILYKNGIPFLSQGADPIKDQSYFLSRLSPSQLGKCLFPIGHLLKSQVRSIARELNFPNHNRKDSQGLCFLGKIKFSDFIKMHLGSNPGPILTVDNQPLGLHQGLWFHTIGQRQKLGLSGGPWYVVDKLISQNTLVVCHQNQLTSFSSSQFKIHDLLWIPHPPSSWRKTLFECKLRHGPHKNFSHFSLLQNQLSIKIKTPDPGIASHQVIAFYQKNLCVGSAFMLKNHTYLLLYLLHYGCRLHSLCTIDTIYTYMGFVCL